MGDSKYSASSPSSDEEGGSLCGWEFVFCGRGSLERDLKEMGGGSGEDTRDLEFPV